MFSYLLEYLGLDNRIVKSPDMLDAILSKPIDYTAVNEQLIKERERSLEYLNREI